MDIAMMEQQQMLLSSFSSNHEDKKVVKEKADAAREYIRSHRRVRPLSRLEMYLTYSFYVLVYVLFYILHELIHCTFKQTCFFVFRRML